MTATGEKILRIAAELTKVRSIVGTAGEVNAAEAVYDRLNALAYFRRNPDNLKLLAIKGDPLGRKNVLAVIEGKKGACREDRKSVV